MGEVEEVVNVMTCYTPPKNDRPFDKADAPALQANRACRKSHKLAAHKGTTFENIAEGDKHGSEYCAMLDVIVENAEGDFKDSTVTPNVGGGEVVGKAGKVSSGPKSRCFNLRK